MNDIFNKYINGSGKRYASSAMHGTSPFTCTLAGKEHTFYVTEFAHGRELFRFFECGKVGFLSEKATNIPESLLANHKNIVENIGIVRDLCNFSDVYMQNISDAFLCEVPEKNMQLLAEDLADKRKENPMDMPLVPAVQLQDLSIFAYEANGNVFLYDHAGKLYLYASDHCYANVTPVAGYPEFTLYHIKNMSTFEDFINTFCNNFYA